jgi:rhamnose transport system substrate-binding protein
MNLRRLANVMMVLAAIAMLVVSCAPAATPAPAAPAPTSAPAAPAPTQAPAAPEPTKAPEPTQAPAAAPTEAPAAAPTVAPTEAPAATPAASAATTDTAGVATNPKDLNGKPLTILDVPKLIGIDYFAATAKGMQDAAKELGNVKVTTDAPTEAKIEKQIEFIDNDITQGPDVITYASNDPVAIAPVLRKALSQGIHVIGYDADAETNAREWFVNQVNFDDFGFTMVDLVAKNVGEDAKIGIVTSSLTAPNQNKWIEYIKQRIADKYPKMKILDIRPSEEDQNLAFTVTQDLMKAYPDMNAVLGLSSVAFPGAADAVSQANKCDKIYVTGGSTPKAMKKFVKSGCVKDVVLWNPVDLGYATVYAARAVADGKLKPGATELEAGKLGKLSISGSVILLGKPFVFTKDNIDQFDF